MSRDVSAGRARGGGSRSSADNGALSRAGREAVGSYRWAGWDPSSRDGSVSRPESQTTNARRTTAPDTAKAAE
ncbi:hypothetical protein GCM10023167_08430 [Brevibacterium pityocampae]|uniref:Uncharacterized protein n=1 Tax=Brevibacterium pityocampae TaxID=506594 RepID=A0ABP8J6N0_9MICO